MMIRHACYCLWPLIALAPNIHGTEGYWRSRAALVARIASLAPKMRASNGWGGGCAPRVLYVTSTVCSIARRVLCGMAVLRPLR